MTGAHEDDEAAVALERFFAGPDKEALGTDLFVDWRSFWQRDRSQAEWVYQDVLARGRGHALYASHKDGKSLLLLNIAAQLATGPKPVLVVYLDYEMGEDDVFERLQEMGYGPDSDLSRLRYAVLPSLTDLDTAGGAQRIFDVLDKVQHEWPDHHLVVVFDTTARAVQGAEDKADTYRDFYAHTGVELKRRGITWIRLDHAGKDPGRGQRGSSSKGDDVDVVWRLTRTDNGIQLRRDVSRMSWVPVKVTFVRTENPLHFRLVGDDVPVGTRETAELLDQLEVSVESSVRTATSALKEAGQGRRIEVVSAAVKWRRERADEAGTDPGNTSGNTLWTAEGNGTGKQPTTCPETAGKHRETPSAANRETSVPLEGDTVFPARAPGAAERFDAQVDEVLLAAFPDSTTLPGQNDARESWGASA